MCQKNLKRKIEVVPDNVHIGKNTAILGVTEEADYVDGRLESGGAIMKGGI